MGLSGMWTFVPSTHHFNPWSLSLKPAAVSMYDFFCRKMFFFFEGSCGYSREASFSTGLVGVSCLFLGSAQNPQLAVSFWTKCHSPVELRAGRHRVTGLSHGFLGVLITSDTVEVVSANPVLILPLRRFQECSLYFSGQDDIWAWRTIILMAL